MERLISFPNDVIDKSEASNINSDETKPVAPGIESDVPIKGDQPFRFMLPPSKEPLDEKNRKLVIQTSIELNMPRFMFPPYLSPGPTLAELESLGYQISADGIDSSNETQPGPTEETALTEQESTKHQRADGIDSLTEAPTSAEQCKVESEIPESAELTAVEWWNSLPLEVVDKIKSEANRIKSESDKIKSEQIPHHERKQMNKVVSEVRKEMKGKSKPSAVIMEPTDISHLDIEQMCAVIEGKNCLNKTDSPVPELKSNDHIRKLEKTIEMTINAKSKHLDVIKNQGKHLEKLEAEKSYWDKNEGDTFMYFDSAAIEAQIEKCKASIDSNQSKIDSHDKLLESLSKKVLAERRFILDFNLKQEDMFTLDENSEQCCCVHLELRKYHAELAMRTREWNILLTSKEKKLEELNAVDRDITAEEQLELPYEVSPHLAKLRERQVFLRSKILMLDTQAGGIYKRIERVRSKLAFEELVLATKLPEPIKVRAEQKIVNCEVPDHNSATYGFLVQRAATFDNDNAIGDTGGQKSGVQVECSNDKENKMNWHLDECSVAPVKYDEEVLIPQAKLLKAFSGIVKFRPMGDIDQAIKKVQKKIERFCNNIGDGNNFPQYITKLNTQMCELLKEKNTHPNSVHYNLNCNCLKRIACKNIYV